MSRGFSFDFYVLINSFNIESKNIFAEIYFIFLKNILD